MILVDSNTWIDLIQEGPVWLDWSRAQVQHVRAQQRSVINPAIYAELAPTYDDPAALDKFLNTAKATMKPLSLAAAYSAGRAFLGYRQKHGTKTGVLPDFLSVRRHKQKVRRSPFATWHAVQRIFVVLN